MQSELRTRLRKFLASEGVTQKFIANQISIETPILSRFKNAKINLEEIDAKLLDDFLKSKNY